MTVLLGVLILSAPFAVAVALGWLAHRSGVLRFHPDQFMVSAPMAGRLFDDGPDTTRLSHELDAIRTRFEQQPAWPSPGVTGERR